MKPCVVESPILGQIKCFFGEMLVNLKQSPYLCTINRHFCDCCVGLLAQLVRATDS